MKVGNTRIRLAGAAIVRLQVNRLFKVALFVLLFLSKLWSQNTMATLPIHLVGKLVFIEAKVNGIKGHFLFDTGAPSLILNNKYYKEELLAVAESELMGFNGQTMTSASAWTDKIEIAGIKLPNVSASLLDLSMMENIKKIPIHGIIGYEVLKNTIWKLDFECRELTIANAKTAAHVLWSGSPPPTDSIDLQFSDHLPFAFVNLADKRLRMAFDTGSERNHLQDGTLPAAHFQQRGSIKIASLTAEARQYKAGFAPGFSIGNLAADSLEIILSDLTELNQTIKTRLDGILGTVFMIDFQIAIDYRRRKAYFWRSTEKGVHSDIAYENAP
ncbi:MAG: clan AA aspartic protease [Saprospiraceae bacterium]|nr:clan AA aspartic protease [Saprospiraceae bacterium]